ncbi:MAG: SRPBCC family protein [Streptomycetaceae bacterium]|nr:SRPBCC family protein [Streptomycetaceae bacterium]
MPTLSVTTVIDRPAYQVWNAVRDFRDPSAWYPVPLADAEGGAGAAAEPGAGDQVVRKVRAPGGALLHERLVEHDDDTCQYTYEVLGLEQQPCRLRLDGPCLATLRVESIIGGTMARVVWSVRYEPVTSQGEVERQRMRQVERELFRPALKELRRKMS